MLTEPDMHARYIGAALGLIATELRAATSPEARHRLSAFAAHTQNEAQKLVDALRVTSSEHVTNSRHAVTAPSPADPQACRVLPFPHRFRS
jgi:hypothetical protein